MTTLKNVASVCYAVLILFALGYRFLGNTDISIVVFLMTIAFWSAGKILEEGFSSIANLLNKSDN